MGIPISSNFDLSSGLPLDSRTVVDTSVNRDLIPDIERYVGLSVFVTDENITYQLQNGTTNGDWVAIGGGGSPITIENTNSLFSTGLTGAGTDSTADNSNFFGANAGFEATNAEDSNFFGYGAGNQAIDAYSSNFLGNFAGYQATNAKESNFFSNAAGQGATNANNSNFIGQNAGYQATAASYSNFLGNNAGFQATGAATFGVGDTITADNGATSEYVNGTTVKWLSGDWTSVTEVSANGGDILADSDGTCTGYIAVTITYPTTFPLTVGEELISDNGATGTYISDTEVFPLTGDWAASTTVTGQTSGIVADISTDAYITIVFTDIRYAQFNSNFFGNNAGYQATNAYNSNFLGVSAGYFATDANNSNFFGINAGNQTTNTNNSNFLGENAGNLATNASYSNFFGREAGQLAANANNSNFFGSNAGYQAIGEEGEEFASNFIGFDAGYQATYAKYSNFIGYGPGYQATNAKYSNFLGSGAGAFANNASFSNFFGSNAGLYATNASYSNFFGSNAGGFATGAATFGVGDTITADNGATSEYVNGTTVKWLSGDWTSVTLVSANAGEIIADSDGTCTGYIAVTITYPTTFPLTVGETLISDNGATGTYISDTEVFPLTGDWAASTTVTGQNSGIVADISTDAYITIVFTDIRYAQFNSNFFGNNAGFQATNAYESNFFSNAAGQGATNANNSNFLGENAGNLATNASYSNFFGENAGFEATNADNSNFFGANAGNLATNASYSNFFGREAGQLAANAANSIFIGQETGINDTVDNTINGLSSILIGSFTNTGGFSNSILLGSGINGSPISNTKANQFMLADTITDVRWSGIEYTLPSSQAANAGDVLTNDGAGVLSWASALRGLFAQTDDSTPVTATTVETSLIGTGVGTLTIPANGFQVGDSFSAVLIGHLSCVGTATLQIRVKTVTGILLADSGVMAMNTTTDKHWKLDINFTIKLLGAATVAAISSGGLFAYTKDSGLNFEGVNFSLTNNTTFDTTISNTLVVTAEWNTNNAGNSIYTEIFTLNKSY